VFLQCTVQAGQKVDVLLTTFLQLWLKFWAGIDNYWIVPVRKLFYFHHWFLDAQIFEAQGYVADSLIFFIVRSINILRRFPTAEQQ